MTRTQRDWFQWGLSTVAAAGAVYTVSDAFEHRQSVLNWLILCWFAGREVVKIARAHQNQPERTAPDRPRTLPSATTS